MKLKIKTIVALAISVGFGLFSFQAKSQAFQIESHNFSVGYGFGNFGNAVLNTYENNSNYSYSSTGPLFFKYEYGISENFGIGVNATYLTGIAGFNSESNGTTYYNEISRTGYNIMLRFNWHFGEHDMIDPYFGIAAGFRNNDWQSDFGDPNIENLSVSTIFPLGLEATFGTRFFITENIGAYVEVGLARAIMQVGLTSTF
ncbi:MAG: outer membrane beta-barrel protein [Flavobacteriales bacterium]